MICSDSACVHHLLEILGFVNKKIIGMILQLDYSFMHAQQV